MIVVAGLTLTLIFIHLPLIDLKIDLSDRILLSSYSAIRHLFSAREGILFTILLVKNKMYIHPYDTICMP